MTFQDDGMHIPMDLQRLAEAQADIERTHRHIAMMIGEDATIITRIEDPDKGINGEYRVVRTSDGVHHIVHLEDDLYTSDFIIHRHALYHMTADLVSYFHE